MLSPFVRLYITRRAKEEKCSLPEDYKQRLKQIAHSYGGQKNKILFSWLWDVGCRMPNASSTIPRLVLVNSEWAFLLVTHYEDCEVQDAFAITMGHEFTHLENDYFFLEPFSKDGKFVYWVNEVHADYGGVDKAFSGDRMRGVRAMEFKKKRKGNKDKDGRMHPSWARRIDFVRNSNFDDKLIRFIAELSGCKNRELIERVCSHYSNIVLKSNE